MLRYPGSKWSLAPAIVARMPDHYHYVEPFFGSGAVFFSKPPAPHEVINDLNDQVVNLFRTLRCRPDDLCWAISLTPWSRVEYDESHVVTGNPLEDARRFVIRCWQAHAADMAKKTGWRTRGATQRARSMSDRWARVPDQLHQVAGRLLLAEIEHRPAVEVIARHNSPDTLLYLDPPYVQSARTQALYGCEMTDDDHRELLAAAVAHTGPVIISGYTSDLYNDILDGWHQTALTAPKAEKAAVRTEILWANRAAAAGQLALL